jgi:23S rRNA (pseudouridine1915-N3)-methyltransferase
LLLHIIARGKIGRSPEAELVDRYLKRIAWPTRVTELPDAGGKQPTLPPDTITILLDEKGEELTSVELARFLVGAADGFDDRTRQQADHLLAFGKATWPHLLVRSMLAEQLWRATSILANHPYHREG